MKSTVLQISRMHFYISIFKGFDLFVYGYVKGIKERVFTDAKSDHGRFSSCAICKSVRWLGIFVNCLHGLKR